MKFNIKYSRVRAFLPTSSAFITLIDCNSLGLPIYLLISDHLIPMTVLQPQPLSPRAMRLCYTKTILLLSHLPCILPSVYLPFALIAIPTLNILWPPCDLLSVDPYNFPQFIIPIFFPILSNLESMVYHFSYIYTNIQNPLSL